MPPLLRMDFGRVVRFLNNEYVGKHRDREKVHRDLSPHIRKDDMDQIDRILFQGCPAQLQYELPREHKLRMMRRGNQKSVLENMEEVKSTMNKEERYSHIIPFLSFFCRFSNQAHHVPQGMVIKKGKKPRIVWDSSTKEEPDDIVMNDIVPLERESDMTFCRVENRLFNTSIQYPRILPRCKY